MGIPRFPIDGMVSRHVLDASGKLGGFELTTPGLRGQSGGPAFDTDGRIWGMQSQTWHLDLNFDVEQNVLREGKRKKITSNPFLHAGRCVHVDVLKDFMCHPRMQWRVYSGSRVAGNQGSIDKTAAV
jgi:hypothetical protein